MAYVNGTTHYNLPQTVGTDKRDWADTNQAFADVDAALFGAVDDVAQAQSEIDALTGRMNTAEENIADNTADIAGLDTRLTTAEGAITSQQSQITDLRQDTEDMICAFNEPSATSTHAYAIGDYFIYNDVLYRAIQAIAIGDTIVPDTNCTTTNVTTEIQAIEDLSGDVTQLQTDVAAAQQDITDLEDETFKLRYTGNVAHIYVLDQLADAVAFLADKPLNKILNAVIEVFEGDYEYRVVEKFTYDGHTYLGVECTHLEQTTDNLCIDTASLTTDGNGSQFHSRRQINLDGTMSLTSLSAMTVLNQITHSGDAYKYVRVYY